MNEGVIPVCLFPLSKDGVQKMVYKDGVHCTDSVQKLARTNNQHTATTSMQIYVKLISSMERLMTFLRVEGHSTMGTVVVSHGAILITVSLSRHNVSI